MILSLPLGRMAVGGTQRVVRLHEHRARVHGCLPVQTLRTFSVLWPINGHFDGTYPRGRIHATFVLVRSLRLERGLTQFRMSFRVLPCVRCPFYGREAFVYVGGRPGHAEVFNLSWEGREGMGKHW